MQQQILHSAALLRRFTTTHGARTRAFARYSSALRAVPTRALGASRSAACATPPAARLVQTRPGSGTTPAHRTGLGSRDPGAWGARAIPDHRAPRRRLPPVDASLRTAASTFHTWLITVRLPEPNRAFPISGAVAIHGSRAPSPRGSGRPAVPAVRRDRGSGAVPDGRRWRSWLRRPRVSWCSLGLGGGCSR